MAYTAPRTWTTGELVTAAIMNTHVRDNFTAVAPTVLGQVLGGDGSAPAAVGGMTLITACRLTTTASINISSIASGYKALCLEIFLRSTVAAATTELILMRFNAAASNYYWVRSQRNHNSVYGTAEGIDDATMQVGTMPGPGIASAYGLYTIKIPYYDSPSTLKSFFSTGHLLSGSASTAPKIDDAGGTWRAASAITQIELFGTTCNAFAASSQVLLYGLT